MARARGDDDACRILCAVAVRVHAPEIRPLPEMIPLAQWLRDLEPAAGKHKGNLVRCAETARALLWPSRGGPASCTNTVATPMCSTSARPADSLSNPRAARRVRFRFRRYLHPPSPDVPDRPVAPLRDAWEVVTRAENLERQRRSCSRLAWTGLPAAWLPDDADPLTDGRPPPCRAEVSTEARPAHRKHPASDTERSRANAAKS
jgi:streptomycin 6-kinase